jgi:hypothetical protein
VVLPLTGISPESLNEIGLGGRRWWFVGGVVAGVVGRTIGAHQRLISITPADLTGVIEPSPAKGEPLGLNTPGR